ncbi:MAG: DUF5131 family protein [Candidatus Paceibacterota bacterium]|jgi:protein gp37
MGEATKILWAGRPLPDGSIEPGFSWNPWIGCTKVSAGCLNCYAETLNSFHKWNPEGWGKGKPRKLTSDTNWKKPIQWAKKAVKDGVTRRVFCASLADVFDDEVPNEWRLRLFALIMDTEKIGGLEWLILTKRPENIETMLPWMSDTITNIRIGVTCENQEMADKRILELLRAWRGKNFVSVEPMLEEVNLRQSTIDFLDGWYADIYIHRDTGEAEPMQVPMRKLDWVICGCESGSNARPMNIDWTRSLRDQCVEASTPFFLKQMMVDGKLVKMPELDGKIWSQFPEVRG